MDTRYKFKEVRKFISNLYKDYKSDSVIPKKEKRKAIFKTFKLLLIYIYNGITAPLIYPIWYIFRKPITKKVLSNITWEEVVSLIDNNKTHEVKSKLKTNGGSFLYWLWTYGDLRDPLGMGEIMTYGIPNTFWNRYKENAFRNARFTYNFMEYQTGIITNTYVSIDTRDFSYMHKSWGIGDNADGVYFLWMKDERGKYYFVYKDNNQNNIWYYGYVGLYTWGRLHARFELSYRATDSSYRK